MYCECILAKSLQEKPDVYRNKGFPNEAREIMRKRYAHWAVAAGLLKSHVFEKLSSKRIILFIQNPIVNHWTFTAIFSLRSYIILNKKKLQK